MGDDRHPAVLDADAVEEVKLKLAIALQAMLLASLVGATFILTVLVFAL